MNRDAGGVITVSIKIDDNSIGPSVLLISTTDTWLTNLRPLAFALRRVYSQGIDKSAGSVLTSTIRLYQNSSSPLSQLYSATTISNFLNAVMPDDTNLFIVGAGRPGGATTHRNFKGRIQYFRVDSVDPGTTYPNIPLEACNKS